MRPQLLPLFALLPLAASCTSLLGDFSSSSGGADSGADGERSSGSDSAAGDEGTADAPSPGTDATSDAPTGVDAANDATTGADAAHDASTDGAIGPGDGAAPDAGDAPSGCAGQTVDTQNGIFVLVGGNTTQSCGDVSTPCGSVQLGLDRAHTLGRTIVYVGASSTPYLESITLYPGLTVQGGWSVIGSTWSPICTGTANQAVVIQGTASSGVTVTASSLGGTATLSTLEVSAVNASNAMAQSLYGIMATGTTTTLVLDDVVVSTGAAGDGPPGNPGPPGTAGANTCSTTGTGATGTVGPPGTGSTGGGFSQSGYAPGAGVTTGNTGKTGDYGVPGSAAECEICGTTVCETPVNQCTGPTSGTCGNPGTSGCGGAGGTGGQPGGGGGSAVGVFVWGATVSSTGGSVTSGNGGAGGAGGTGGNGGTGGAGGVSTGVVQCPTNPSGTCGVNCDWGSATTLANGGAGGNGGTGGLGGQGGGGAGGWSCAVYAGGSGAFNGSGTPLMHGNQGTGGAAGGAAGTAKTTCP